MAIRIVDVVLTDRTTGVNAPCDVVLTPGDADMGQGATPTIVSNASKRKRKRKAVKARTCDRHAKGYMAAYMRKRRLSALSKPVQ